MSCSATAPITTTQMTPAVAPAIATTVPAPVAAMPRINEPAPGVTTPEAWQPGDKVLVGSPKTVAEVEKRLAGGLETTDWYFTVKNPAREQIEKSLAP